MQPSPGLSLKASAVQALQRKKYLFKGMYKLKSALPKKRDLKRFFPFKAYVSKNGNFLFLDRERNEVRVTHKNYAIVLGKRENWVFKGG